MFMVVTEPCPCMTCKKFGNPVFSESQQEKSDKLKEFVREYFKEATHETDDQKIGLIIPPLDTQTENLVRSDVRQFVMTHNDHTWTGRAVAR